MDVRALEDSRSDAELVSAAMAGDRGAFAAIYDRYADRLHDFCWSLLRDRDEAADATQDAFLVAAERLGQLRDPERLRPWLYAVARSQALRRAPARHRRRPRAGDRAGGPARACLERRRRAVRARPRPARPPPAPGARGRRAGRGHGDPGRPRLRAAQPAAGPGRAIPRRAAGRPARPAGLPGPGQAADRLGRPLLAADP